MPTVTASGHVAISFELRPDRLVVEVADDGSGFEEPPSTDGGGDLSEGGLGIAIIRSIADEVEIERRSGRPRLPSPLRQAAPVGAVGRDHLRSCRAGPAQADRRFESWSDRVRAGGGPTRRPAGRGRARDRTGAARLPSRRDVGRERALGGGPCRRRRRAARGDRAGRLQLPPQARGARARRVRPLLQRRRKPGAVVRPAPSLGAQARSGGRPLGPLGGRLRRRQPRVCRRRRRGARPATGCGRVLPRLPPLRRSRARARALPRCRAHALHPHPLGRRERLVGAAGADRARDSRGRPRERRRRLSHRALAAGVPRRLRRPRVSTRQARSSPPIRSRSTRTSSARSREATVSSSASATFSLRARSF